MAEEFDRSRQYEYGRNSNLVLEAERDGLRRAKDEASGEVETLYGKTGNLRMGDRLTYEKKSNDDNLGAKSNKSKRNKDQADAESDPFSAKRKRKKRNDMGKGFMGETEDLDSINYRPKTRETR